MPPLVSILIPAYNAGEWISDTIKSALAQTWPAKEIIVVDDGSTDDTLSVARQFASKEVQVVGQNNQGAAVARNKALSLCQGDYIQWLDADDLLAPDKIATQMAVLAGSGGPRTLLSSAWGRFINRPHKAKFCPTALWSDLTPAEWMLRKMGQNVFMQTGAWLVSRELTTAAGPWDARLSYDDDGEYFARVILASNAIRFVPEGRVMYRMSGSSRLSHIGHSDRKLESLLLSMKLQIQYLRSLEDSERARAACRAFLQSYLVFFYPQRPGLVEQIQQLASACGGKLDEPRLQWKYAWIQKAFGWDLARRTQMFLPGIRWSMVQRWDKVLFNVEKRSALRTAASNDAKNLSPA